MECIVFLRCSRGPSVGTGEWCRLLALVAWHTDGLSPMWWVVCGVVGAGCRYVQCRYCRLARTGTMERTTTELYVHQAPSVIE